MDESSITVYHAGKKDSFVLLALSTQGNTPFDVLCDGLDATFERDRSDYPL